MAGGLLALLDDVAMLLDDTVVMSKVAAKKTNKRGQSPLNKIIHSRYSLLRNTRHKVYLQTLTLHDLKIIPPASLPQERASRLKKSSRDPAFIQPVAIVLLSSLFTRPRWM